MGINAGWGGGGSTLFLTVATVKGDEKQFPG